MFNFGNLQNEPVTWKWFLMARGCGEIAFADFVALMNCGNWGYSEAARIIHNADKEGQQLQGLSDAKETQQLL